MSRGCSQGEEDLSTSPAAYAYYGGGQHAGGQHAFALIKPRDIFAYAAAAATRLASATSTHDQGSHLVYANRRDRMCSSPRLRVLVAEIACAL